MKKKQALAAIMAATIIGTTAFSGTVMAATYTVQKGDTLSKIPKNNGTTVAKLAADNGIENPNKIRVGQVLSIGTPTATATDNNAKRTTAATSYKGILSTFFDATYYAAQNPDVVAVYGTKSENLFSHFLTYGIYEGRQANANFNVYAYMSSYKDLEAAYGDNTAHDEWAKQEPQKEDYLPQTDYELDHMDWVADEPLESEYTGQSAETDSSEE